MDVFSFDTGVPWDRASVFENNSGVEIERRGV